MSDQELSGRSALVTGGARGIGRSVAERLVAAGAGVVLFDVDEHAVLETARELAAHGGRVKAVGGDVRRTGDVVGAVETALREHGGLDVAVAVAGVAAPVPLLELEDVDWERTIDTNLSGVFRTVRAAGRAMRVANGGAIVVISSINAFHVEEQMAAYDSSKGGVTAFVRSAALDLARDNVRINAVAPGVILTRLADWVTKDPVLAKRYLQSIPLGRFGETSDVADAVLFLASPRASYVTGQMLVVDGGQTLGIPLSPDAQGPPS